MLRRFLLAGALLCLAGPTLLHADDGYDLWLRYPRIEQPDVLAGYRATLAYWRVDGDSETLDAVRRELALGLGGLLGIGQDGAGAGLLLLGTPAASPTLRALGLDEALGRVGPEGFLIRSVRIAGQPATVIAANTDLGVLYGAFHLLRLVQTRQPVDRLDVASSPAIAHRLLNHWDNLDRTVERGYAGFSLWDWHKLPDYLDPRYTDYARANASLGINGVALTNVNANATSLTPMYLEKAAALANVFRPYGLRVFLTARFSAPLEIGGLPTADPLDPAVAAWWNAKADEIYRYIPDFGGFVVKANSEGQPGPQDYDRSHADGANLLADAVAPHGGIVMWRAFVYSNEEPDDRARQAYNEFVPLDGTFRPNVLIQVKNGPIDFQPREPFHPLFGAMPATPLMMEFQITQEYLGQATHIAYLAPLFKEVLDADTYAMGAGSTVARVFDGDLHNYPTTGIAGVANIGTDRNWCGSAMNCVNWYAFGRLAWDVSLSSEHIADEWLRMTFSNEPAFVGPVTRLLMGSREAVVDYMTPLGLHHLMGRGHHYGPGPWVSGGPRADWTSVYYHRADSAGIGFDRTSAGSNAVAQYAGPVRDRFERVETTPDELLLWFHHLPWTHRMRSGQTLWDELLARYQRGVDAVRGMQQTWDSVRPYVDPERFAQIEGFLAIQEKEARWWRDASVLYWQTFSGMTIPEDYEKPEHDLDYYEGLRFPYAPGN
ncbi:MAG: alpha-glucuronidase family glycosyl hydrolase [Rhodothermales bacterium]